MNFIFATPDSNLANSAGCHATLTRLIGNLRGFVYRRRHDAGWTMDFVSGGIRDITGFEPHRFMANASIAFGDLIAPSDRPSVEERVRLAVLQRNRLSVNYRIRTAHGALVPVEDRLTPVFSTAGQVLAIEGIIDLARFHQAAAEVQVSTLGEAPHAARFPFHTSN